MVMCIRLFSVNGNVYQTIQSVNDDVCQSVNGNVC